MMPPPPHMMGGPPHPGMMMYPPPPMMGGFTGPPPHVIMNEKIFKVMNPRDVQFVVQQQLKQIRSSDPFSDDYYFHNYNVKRERAKAVGGGGALPLPSWKLEHVKPCDPRDASRATKSREWETQNQVLGRTAKSSLYRPRELLNLSGDSDDVAAASGDGPVLSRASTPSNSVFLNDTWAKRQRIDQGMGHLLALQDARHLLDARRINVQQFHQMDPSQMDPSLVDLRDKTATLLLDLASVLGVSAGACDTRVLFAILSVSKGKKLVCRALPLLHPSARFVLFPYLVQFMLAMPIDPTADETTIADEDRLAQTLVVALLYQQPSPSPAALAESLQLALDGQSLHSLSMVLHNRARAELLQALLQKGGAVCAGAADDLKEKWLKYQDLFVELASRIKASTQDP
ncbi:Aste57867_15334 [Aphanomyces stellatus]|uniref:Aste57867_15334 protein n=1 Tax=Aphanomyces stellatus TaxID=120398 RepID=A0A485L490_9STRA|nr:hypothetical protein As57867_015278 [Aphanomyces stellatus]VFT92142.1 Aste57867_15334 [Aphanomyces stellatus]